MESAKIQTTLIPDNEMANKDLRKIQRDEKIDQEKGKYHFFFGTVKILYEIPMLGKGDSSFSKIKM